MFRRISVIVFAAVLGLTFGPIASSGPVKPMESCPTGTLEASIDGFTNGRMRKLHLVRPDLIPYPVFFEIFC